MNQKSDGLKTLLKPKQNESVSYRRMHDTVQKINHIGRNNDCTSMKVISSERQLNFLHYCTIFSAKRAKITISGQVEVM